MATASYNHGFAIDNWLIGAGLGPLDKTAGNADLVRGLTRTYFEKNEDLQFRVVAIPRRKWF